MALAAHRTSRAHLPRGLGQPAPFGEEDVGVGFEAGASLCQVLQGRLHLRGGACSASRASSPDVGKRFSMFLDRARTGSLPPGRRNRTGGSGASRRYADPVPVWVFEVALATGETFFVDRNAKLL